jgi:hypothetical protein
MFKSALFCMQSRVVRQKSIGLSDKSTASIFRVKEEATQESSKKQAPASCWILAWITVRCLLLLVSCFFEPEDGGSVFLQNLGEPVPDYMPLHTGGQ